MSDEGVAMDTAPAEHPPTPWIAIVALALGIFVMITIEELPIGVLTLVGDDLGISEGATGLAVTVPGVLAGVIAVLTPSMIGRLDRRLALVAALLLVFASAATSAISQGLWTLLASRLFAGLAIGVFWALLGVVAARVAHPDDVAKALTVAFSGAAAAVVLGVPIAAWVGSLVGWRWAFVLVGALGLVVAAVLLTLLPKVEVTEKSSLRQIGASWSIPTVRLGVLVTLVLVTAHFTAYTYASPLLQQLAHVHVSDVGAMLFVFGICGLIGNFAAGPLLRRFPRGTFIALPVGILIAVTVLGLAVGSPTGGALVMGLWGLFGGALGVVTQAWILHTAGDLAEPATALNSGAFNIAIAFGALIGGRFFDFGGTGAVTAAAAAGLVLATVLALLAAAGDRRAATPGGDTGI